MSQTSRLLVIALLTLVQTFAPLVHAHTGGAESAGFLHVPGLERFERLAGSPEICAKTRSAGDAADLIVGLAPALENCAARIAPPVWGPAPAPARPAESAAPRRFRAAAAYVPQVRAVRRAATPRAPPV